MPSASSQGALGAIVAMLAIAALAASRPVVAPDAKLTRPALIMTSTAARALRDGQTLDINSAQASELLLLPGVGPKLAERIVAERQRRDGFRNIDELREVRGIGPSVFARIARFVSLGRDAQSPSVARGAQKSNSNAALSVPVK